MNIGYACITLCVYGTQQYSCMLKNANNDSLLKITKANLNALSNILDYNNQNNIRLLRICSGLVPFGSAEVNKTDWQNIFKSQFDVFSKKIKEYNIRISMHPGQYTVLNSPNPLVTAAAVKDLEYHNDVINCLGGSGKNKIVLHIGGKYGSKPEAIERFKNNFLKLSDDIKSKIAIENDDVNFNIADVLDTAKEINIPVVYDVLHNELNPPPLYKSNEAWIKECKELWKSSDGRQKIHYSEQQQGTKKGTHSNSIDILAFMDFYDGIKNIDTDIMLEVKDKNISALKCINSVNNDIIGFKKDLVNYKLSLDEISPYKYNEIKSSAEKGAQVKELYLKLQTELKQTPTKESTVRLITNIMQNELPSFYPQFEKLLKRYHSNTVTIAALKNYFYRSMVTAGRKDIYNSYFFR